MTTNLVEAMAEYGHTNYTTYDNDNISPDGTTIMAIDTHKNPKHSNEDSMTIVQMEREKIDNAIKNSYKMIWVTFRKEGLHKYPAALDDPKLATGKADDVSFLGYIHRHIFHFKVAIQVFHDDRDIEFIQFKRWCEGLYNDGVLELDFKSCEMISDDLYLRIATRYPGRNVRIEVSEDGENGCEISY